MRILMIQSIKRVLPVTLGLLLLLGRGLRGAKRDQRNHAAAARNYGPATTG